jgi:hypothetical protein
LAANYGFGVPVRSAGIAETSAFRHARRNLIIQCVELVLSLQMAIMAPKAESWREHEEEPADFDASAAWSFTSKLISTSGVKRWGCVFCPHSGAGWNATKAAHHVAAIKGVDVLFCPGIHNGSMPKWLHEAVRKTIAEKYVKSNSNSEVRPLRG